MSATSSAGADEEIVRAETPRGEETLARVVDRKLAGNINGGVTLTVEAVGRRWRVDAADVEELP